MASDVVITFGADDREASRIIANLQRQNENLAASIAKIGQTSRKEADEEAKRAKWLAGVKEQSAKLEYQAKLQAIQAEKKAEQEKANWMAKLRQNSAQLAQQIGVQEIQAAKKAAEDEKKIAADKAAWMARLRQNSADLERKVNQQRLREVEQVLKGNSDQKNQLAELAAGYMTIQTVTGLITSELRDQLQVSKEIANLQKSTAQPQGNFLRNLGVVSDAERKAAVARIGEISKTTGVSQSTLYSAGATALSAAGDMSPAEALEAVAVAAQLAPDDPTELTRTAGGLLDLASVTGSSDAKKNAGFLLRIGSQARIESMQDISANLVPAAKSVLGYGGTAEQAAALTATMTTAMKDTTGAHSGTASVSLARQLANFLPEEDRYTFDSKGRQRLARRGTGLSTVEERIRYMQDHPELLDRFMGQGSWEAKAEIPSRLMLTKGTTEANLFAQRTGEYGGDLAADTDAFIRGMGAEPLQQQADLTRRGLNVAEGMNLANTSSAARDSIYTVFDEYQKARGVGYATRTEQALMIQVKDMINRASGGYLGTSAGEAAIGAISTGRSGPYEQTEELKKVVKILESLDAKATGRSVNIDAHTE